jgi:murein DD-endopeptidase MepM/ murein hydrolase activator NlpD
MVRIRHTSGYESYYLHLSAFAPGMRGGASVSQGETVGRVGATGLATGPHLHYGLKKNGVFVNPLREHRNLPPGDPVPASAMAAFAAERDRALASLGPAQSTPVATR